MNSPKDAESKILVAATNVADSLLVAEVLREDFDHVSTNSEPDTAVRDFEALRPQILVLAFETIEESERYYLGLYRRSSLIHAITHRTLVLCHRRDAFRAYELCRKQHFDDYVVFWPVNYDPHRVRMAALLAARSISRREPAGPSPMQFAVQARRVAELESLLQTSLDRGDAQIAQFGDSLREMETGVGHAIDGFSRRMVEAERNHTVEVKNPDEFQRDLTQLREGALHRPFAAANELLKPLQHWVGDFKKDLAPQLESVRALANLSKQVRPLVLVVDDDEFQHSLIRQLLSGLSVDLAFASSGIEALSWLRNQKPNLILMDFQLPDENGVEIIRRLKSAPTTAAIRVILITGTSTRKVLGDSYAAGAVDFMVKPFDRNRLLAGISRHLPGAVIIDRPSEAPVDVSAGPLVDSPD